MSVARRNVSLLFIVTALAEGVTGLLLLAWPPALMALLLGTDRASPEAAVVARIAGAALVSLGVACWVGRHDPDRPAQKGLLIGVLIYDLGAAGVLACAGWFSGLSGVALWPAVALHSLLAAWCVACLCADSRGGAGANPESKRGGNV
jgi:hypothetical protein